MPDDGIAAQILEMTQRDQAMRRASLAGEAPWDAEIDRANTRRLRSIVASIGWPTRSRVGDAAEHAAWLLLQHADHDLAFQKGCLELMRAEPAGEVCANHLAYLEDRIATHEDRAQRFGTQLRPSGDGGYEPAPLADASNVDALRASVGLGPLAEYVSRVNENARLRAGRAKPR